MIPYIKNLVINKGEYKAKNEQGKQVNEEESWGFQSANDFFKAKN